MFAMSSFIRPSMLSTSLRRAADAVLIAADSFRVNIVSSVRSSDNAALNRYACCIFSSATSYDAAYSCLRTLSRSFTVNASFRTLPILSTSNARVARIRLLAVGVAKVFSNAAKNRWVSNGGLAYEEGGGGCGDGRVDGGSGGSFECPDVGLNGTGGWLVTDEELSVSDGGGGDGDGDCGGEDGWSSFGGGGGPDCDEGPGSLGWAMEAELGPAIGLGGSWIGLCFAV